MLHCHNWIRNINIEHFCIYACISRTFLTRIYTTKLGCGLYTELKTQILPEKAIITQTTEPMMPVLYVVKLPLGTVSSRHHQLSIDRCSEVGRLWHHCQISINAASGNQSAANAIANILFLHRQNKVRLTYELLLFPNSWPKSLGAAYTRANTV
jgi:hypothetical protein